MRYLIDTNIFVYMASDPEYLNRNIDAIIQDPETLLYISAESVRELIVAYRNKGLCSKRWKSAEAMIVAIEKEFYVKILPLKKNICKRMRIWRSMRRRDTKIPQTT